MSAVRVIRRMFGITDRPPMKVKDASGSYFVVALPMFVVTAIVVMVVSVISGLASGYHSGDRLSYGDIIYLATLFVAGLAALTWLAVQCYRQLRHWGYLDAIHNHTLKIQAEWEAKHGR